MDRDSIGGNFPTPGLMIFVVVLVLSEQEVSVL
jgi:hypothetical protein